jgi:NADH dehydrogenase FAD-containing subunit
VSAIPVWKTSQAAGAEAAALGAIIAAELKGKTPKAYNSPTRHGMLVTLGPNGGAGDAPMPFFGVTSLPGFVAGMKSKDFFAQKAFYGRFQGSDKVPVSA